MRLMDAAAIRNQMNHRSERGSFDLRGRSGCHISCLYILSGRWAFSQCMKLLERSFTWAISGLYLDSANRAIDNVTTLTKSDQNNPQKCLR